MHRPSAPGHGLHEPSAPGSEINDLAGGSESPPQKAIPAAGLFFSQRSKQVHVAGTGLLPNPIIFTGRNIPSVITNVKPTSATTPDEKRREIDDLTPVLRLTNRAFHDALPFLWVPTSSQPQATDR